MESNKFLSIGFNSTSDILWKTLESGLWKKNSMSVCGVRKHDDADATHFETENSVQSLPEKCKSMEN